VSFVNNRVIIDKRQEDVEKLPELRSLASVQVPSLQRRDRGIPKNVVRQCRDREETEEFQKTL